MRHSARPIRSLLFAPAASPELVTKMPKAGADALVIDCEDGSPMDAKEEARHHARRLSAEISGRGSAVFVRVNAVPSAWFADDIQYGLGSGLTGIVVPKVESVDHLIEVERSLKPLGRSDLRVVVGIETALAVADVRLLLAHAAVDAAYFGAEDYVADLGGVRTEGNKEVLYARSRVALAGRLAGVPTLDQVVTDFRNEGAFTAEAREARSLGFSGKLCIHPQQVHWANSAFQPSPAELARARRLISAYEEALAAGSGVISLDGQMVDEPLVRQARQVVAASPDQ